MPLQFYKPTPSNTGFASAISFNSKENCIYIQFIKQVSYDAQRRIGSFKGGKRNNFKFSLNEVGAMIYAIENTTKCSFFHSSKDATSAINFGPYALKDTQEIKGFSLMITKTIGEEKDICKIGFTFGEVTLLREYLKFCLDHCFSAIYSSDKKKYDDYKKNEASNKKAPKTPEAEEAADEGDPWPEETASETDADF